MNLTTLLDKLSEFEVEEEFNNESLIGRTIVARKWDMKVYSLSWVSNMDSCEGKRGVIINITTDSEDVLVRFDSTETWWFPLEFVKTLLI